MTIVKFMTTIYDYPICIRETELANLKARLTWQVRPQKESIEEREKREREEKQRGERTDK